MLAFCCEWDLLMKQSTCTVSENTVVKLSVRRCKHRKGVRKHRFEATETGCSTQCRRSVSHDDRQLLADD